MNYSLHTDQQTIDREAAFRQLFEEYYAPFCLYAKRFIDNKEEREDIVSDVFAKLWTNEELLDFQSKTVLAYIKMCVKNSCLNYLKHEQCEWEYAEKLKKGALEPDSDVRTLDQLYQRLNEILQQLPPEYRKVFMESYFEGKTQQEIADEMNISVKTVGRYKSRVLEILKLHTKDFLPLLLLLCNPSQQ